MALYLFTISMYPKSQIGTSDTIPVQGHLMYFVMFWYVTEVCRNVFIRLC